MTATVPGTQAHIDAMVALHESQNQNIKNDNSLSAPEAPVRPEWIPEKFWDAKTGQANYEALAKSYTELERAKSAPAATTPAPAADAQAPAEGAAQAAVQDAGLDWNDLTAKISSTGGLELDDYAKLAKVGIPREIVDNYISGLTVAAEARVVRTADYVASQTGSEDGMATLETMLTWAVTLPQTTRDYINTMLASEADWKNGLDMLGNAWMKANPMASEGKQIVGGGSANGGGAFESLAEQNAAINDPRYKDSPTYRQMVRQRVAMSKF